MTNAAEEDWRILTALFPDGWQDQAKQTGAIRRRRGITAPDSLLRLFLLHIARGYSLRETVVRAKETGLAAITGGEIVEALSTIRRRATLALHALGAGERGADARRATPGRTRCGWDHRQRARQ